MSRVPMGAARPQRSGAAVRPGDDGALRRGLFNQGVGAEMVARRWGLTRADVDRSAWSRTSGPRRRGRRGAFADEIVPRVDGVRSRRRRAVGARR